MQIHVSNKPQTNLILDETEIVICIGLFKWNISMQNCLTKTENGIHNVLILMFLILCLSEVNVPVHVQKHTHLHTLTLRSQSGFVHAPILTPKTEAPNATRTHRPTSFFSKRHSERVSEGTEERGEFEGVENDRRRIERGIQKAEKQGQM